MAPSLRFLILAALLPGLAACGEQPAPPKSKSTWSGPARVESPPTGRLDRSHAGSAAPQATFEDPDGEAVSLDAFRGRPLLVNLWATWCAPCIAEMPTLDALAVRDGETLQVVAISQDLDGRDKVDSFFAERRFALLEPYLDPQLALMTELKVDTLPTTILYDSDGREVWRMSGMAEWDDDRARGLLAEADVRQMHSSTCC